MQFYFRLDVYKRQVLMVTGNAAVIPTTILEPLRTIPATIAAELGEAPAGEMCIRDSSTTAEWFLL